MSIACIHTYTHVSNGMNTIPFNYRRHEQSFHGCLTIFINCHFSKPHTHTHTNTGGPLGLSIFNDYCNAINSSQTMYRIPCGISCIFKVAAEKLRKTVEFKAKSNQFTHSFIDRKRDFNHSIHFSIRLMLKTVTNGIDADRLRQPLNLYYALSNSNTK